MGEATCDVGVGHVHGNGHDLGVHHFAHGDAGIGRQQPRDAQHADEFIATVYDDELISRVGQTLVAAQVAQHQLQGVPWSHCDHVGGHQTASAIVRIRQHAFDADAISCIHARQHLQHEGLG